MTSLRFYKSISTCWHVHGYIYLHTSSCCHVHGYIYKLPLIEQSKGSVYLNTISCCHVYSYIYLHTICVAMSTVISINCLLLNSLRVMSIYILSLVDMSTVICIYNILSLVAMSTVIYIYILALVAMSTVISIDCLLLNILRVISIYFISLKCPRFIYLRLYLSFISYWHVHGNIYLSSYYLLLKYPRLYLSITFCWHVHNPSLYFLSLSWQ